MSPQSARLCAPTGRAADAGGGLAGGMRRRRVRYPPLVTLWAFLSDIHGNLRMLDRALAQCRERGAEHYGFLGDFLGRGDPDGVIRRVRELGDIVIAGNRDLDWADRVSEESRVYVRQLPCRIVQETFVVAHGDPKLDRELNVNDLKRGAPKSFGVMASSGVRVFLFGHTHHARIWVKPDANAVLQLTLERRVTIGSATAVIVNVGTVGKPFPGKGPASFTLLDDGAARTVEHVLIA